MIPNNNLSVLPWYTSIDQQNARKWWVYGHVYPLYTPAGYILPFQIIVPNTVSPSISVGALYNAETNELVDGDLIPKLGNSGLSIRYFPARGYNVVVYTATLPAYTNMQNGRYYAMLRVGVDGNYLYYYSDVFTVVNDIEPYLKLQWWDNEDFVMDAGTIAYGTPNFKNLLYLQSDLAKPEYPFEEEGETRDGYFFPVKMISEKRYRFNFLAPEYLLDVMRFIRMADFVEIEYHGQKYSVDTFLITPNWEKDGDLAAVEAQFDTATVAKKIGLGYIKAQRGDFNDDFNDDFNNQQ